MMPPFPSRFDDSLERPLEARLEDFERAWETRTLDGSPPRWQDFLPPANQVVPPTFLFWLLRSDIESRIAAGLPALLAESYLDGFRLGDGQGVLERELLAELVRHEYRLRWRRGQRARHSEYLKRYPELQTNLADLVPKVGCTACGNEDVLLADEEAEAAICPACGNRIAALATSPTGTAVPPTQSPVPSVPAEALKTVLLAATPPPTSRPPGRRLGRYELGEEIAHGGMGAVFRAHDPELNRDLAIKVLKPELRKHPELVKRFLAEAQITGQLQHPGVVAVHDIGRGEHGLPFLVMKLVRGQTLDEVLKQRGELGDDLPRFVGVFEQVCQAVAFAHSRRVIHRDLKPANIMVGRYHEVQVMDWGLAKVMPAAEGRTSLEEVAGSATEVETLEDGPRTRGTLGTPAYMPPEQALAEWGRVDLRSDVFCLGGILCEILTGTAPYEGQTRDEVMGKARRGAVAGALARLDACGADGELVALARACLSPEREGRPQDAAEVARCVADYQRGVQERVRAAERQRVAAEARAEEAKATAHAEQRARRRTLALVGVVVAALSLGGGATVWYQQEQSRRAADAALRRARAESEAEAGLREASTLLAGKEELAPRDPERWHGTVSVADAAIKRAEAAATAAEVDPELMGQVQAMRAEVDRQLRDSGLRVELDRIRLEKATVREGHFDFGAAVPHYRDALGRYGITPDDTEAAAAAVRSSELRRELLAALEDWARATKDKGEKERLAAVLKAAEPNPVSFRARWLAAKGKEDGDALAALSREPEAAALPPADLVHLASDLMRLKQPTAAEQLLREAQEHYPDDFWINHELGLVLYKEGPPPHGEEAVRFWTAAMVLRSRSPGTHVNLGNALEAKGDLDGAIRCYQRAIDLDPRYAEPHYNLGLALKTKGDRDGAICCYQKAIDLDPKHAQAHTNLGIELAHKGDLDRAIRCFQKALDLHSKLPQAHNGLGNALLARRDLDGAIRSFQKAIDLDPKLAPAHGNLGRALHAKKDLDGAIRCYQKAIDLDPKSALTYNNLGTVLADMGDRDGAIRCYRKAIDLDPKLPHAHNNLGNALAVKGDLDAAIRCYQKGIDVDPKDTLAHYHLGNALKTKKDLDGAIRCYQKTIDLDPRFALAHHSLGAALASKGDLDGAIRCYQKAIDVDPKFTPAYINLGRVLHAKKDLEGAIRCYQKAIDLDPKLALAHNNLGTVLADQGNGDGAIRCFEKAIDLDPKLPHFHNDLGNALAVKGDFDGAIRCYQKAINLDPKLPLPHNGLGNALKAKGDLDGAIRSYQKAIDLDPKFALAHYNLGNALKDTRELEGAITAYRKSIQLDPMYAQAHANLGRALSDKGDLDGAIGCFQKAIDLDPKLTQAHYNLGFALQAKADRDGAIRSFQEAVNLAPKFPYTHFSLGIALAEKGDLDGAIRCYQKAIDLDPKLLHAHKLLGIALQKKGDLDGAIRCYEKAIEIDPTETNAYNILGLALKTKADLDGAIRCFRKAIDLNPKEALAYYNLGDALHAKKDLDGAIHSYQKAIDLNPTFAQAHNDLGTALADKGDLDSATRCYRKAMELDPKYAAPHSNLGNVLHGKKDLDGAIRCYRKAIDLDPKFALAHNNLGLVLKAKGDLDGAIRCYQRAVDLDSKLAMAHYNLGNALGTKGDLDGAITSYRHAIELQPAYAEAYCNLGDLLSHQGRLAESLAAYRRGHELGSKRPGWRYPSAEWVHRAETLAALEDKVPVFLEGKYRPADNQERLDLAQVCALKNLHKEAVGLYAAAFAADPKLADDLEAAHRYNAACSAAHAGCGQGKDADKLDSKERERWRKQTLEWLRADLALRARQLESGKPEDRATVQQILQHWKSDRDLAGIRDKDALGKLPMEEQEACKKLWMDVDALDQKAQEKR
jgi:tetratricopeptide (TPR) repeat protein